MTATKLAKAPVKRKTTLKPLESGQHWRMGDDVLRVEMVGKLLVHYKLIRAKAVRTPTSISSITTLNKYIKKNKAVLQRKQAV